MRKIMDGLRRGLIGTYFNIKEQEAVIHTVAREMSEGTS